MRLQHPAYPFRNASGEYRVLELDTMGEHVEPNL